MECGLLVFMVTIVCDFLSVCYLSFYSLLGSIQEPFVKAKKCCKSCNILPNGMEIGFLYQIETQKPLKNLTKMTFFNVLFSM